MLHQILAVLSLATGTLSAIFWIKSARVKIPGEKTDPAPSSGDIMWLFPRLREAADYNSKAAIFAAVSAVSGAVASALTTSCS